MEMVLMLPDTPGVAIMAIMTLIANMSEKIGEGDEVGGTAEIWTGTEIMSVIGTLQMDQVYDLQTWRTSMDRFAPVST